MSAYVSLIFIDISKTMICMLLLTLIILGVSPIVQVFRISYSNKSLQNFLLRDQRIC